jgi:mutator protein MutT
MNQPNSTPVQVGLAAVLGPGSGPAGLLVGRREARQALAGYWELPGGKCEPGEAVDACIAREVREEVGLEVTPYRPLSVIDHVYEHAAVRLHPWLCRFSGEPGELPAPWRWIPLTEVRHYTFPPANAPLLDELERLPEAGAADGAASEQPAS